MKAPLTGNSITDRVVYSGLYVPEPMAPVSHTEPAAGAADHSAAERENDAGEALEA